MAQLRSKEKLVQTHPDPADRLGRLRGPAASAPLGGISFGLAVGVTAAIIVFLIGVTTAFFG